MNAAQLHPPFAHRHNDDGTFDSICRNCFKTVASAASEDDLVMSEWFHHCEPPERHLPQFQHGEPRSRRDKRLRIVS